MRNILVTVIATVLVPGGAVVLVPYWILHATGGLASPQVGFLEVVSVALALAGAGMVVWVSATFVAKGGGTPVPIDPPQNFVAEGLYRFVRNPMYFGALLILFAEFDLLPLRLDSLVRRSAVARFALLHSAPRGTPIGAAVRRHLSGLQDADASLDSPKATELGDTPGRPCRNRRSGSGRLDGGFGAILALFRASRSWRRAAREMVGWVQRQISSWQIQRTRRALWPPTTPSARSKG